MATATLDRLPLANSGADRLARLAVDVFEGIREGREMAYRYERLSRLSNVELARLGLTRADLPRAAVNGLVGL
jgi:hypothetical protein